MPSLALPHRHTHPHPHHTCDSRRMPAMPAIFWRIPTRLPPAPAPALPISLFCAHTRLSPATACLSAACGPRYFSLARNNAMLRCISLPACRRRTSWTLFHRTATAKYIPRISYNNPPPVVCPTQFGPAFATLRGRGTLPRRRGVLFARAKICVTAVSSRRDQLTGTFILNNNTPAAAYRHLA